MVANREMHPGRQQEHSTRHVWAHLIKASALQFHYVVCPDAVKHEGGTSLLDG